MYDAYLPAIEVRLVREATRNGKPVRVVHGARSFACDAEDLWEALTNKERLPRWFVPVTGDLKLGGRYQIEGNAGGEVTRCDPLEAFDVTWEYEGQVSWVTVRLRPEGDGTRLTLEHIMPKDGAGEEHWKQFGPGATGVGWELSFLGLAWHQENGGGVIDREANEAWMASEAGKAFVRGCAAAWGKAHVAAGEAPEIACAMAERTAKAYTGE